MTLFDALRHQWRRRFRSPTVARSLVGGLLLVLAAAYFGSLFVAAGWFYPRMMAEIAPDAEPLRLLNGALLYAAVGLTVCRFLLQRSAGSDVRPYLHLPLRRAQVVRILQGVSSLSLLNLLPVVTLAAFWGSTVWPATSAIGAAGWAVGALLLVAITQFLNSLLRAVWERSVGLVLGAAGILAVVGVGSHWLGAGLLRGGSAWLFGGLAAGRLFPLILLVGAAVGSAVAAHWALRARLYAVLGAASGRSAVRMSLFQGRGWGNGDITSIVLLDARLLLRNKRPRQMLLLGLLFIAMFALATVVGDETTAFNEVLFGFFLSGYLGLMVGQFGYAWHGGHFDRLLQTVSPTTLIRAQFLTLAVLCAAPLPLAVPVVAVLAPSVLPVVFALLVYNLGVMLPALILMATWRREALKLDQSAFFNYQGTTSGFFLYGMVVVLGVMGGPVALAMGMGVDTTLFVLGGGGAVGVGAAPFWTRGLGRVLHGQRHAMATGFRDE